MKRSEEMTIVLAELDRARAAILAGDPDWQLGPGAQTFGDGIAQILVAHEGLTGELAERVERVVAFAAATSFATGFAAALSPDLRKTPA